MMDIFKQEIFHTKDFSITVGSLVMALAVIVVNIVLIKVVSSLILRRVRKLDVSDGRTYAIVQLIKYILWIVAIIVSLQVLHIDITFIIASSAALLVGLGLGMQIIFKDFMSGILLLVEGTIKVNDIVEVQDQILKVKEISLRTSRVLTREDNIVIIPNHKFIEENVINWSHNYAPTRFNVDVGVEYTSDIDLVIKCLLQSIENNNDVVQTEIYKPFVRFNNFGDSALEFQLIFWSHNLFRIESTKSNIRYDIAKLFRANNITIPFMQVVLHQKDK